MIVKRLYFAIMSVVCFFSIGAQTFQLDGLNYSVNSGTTTVTVTGLTLGKSFSGSLTIPSSVNYDNGAVTAAGRGSHRQHPRWTGMKI